MMTLPDRPLTADDIYKGGYAEGLGLAPGHHRCCALGWLSKVMSGDAYGVWGKEGRFPKFRKARAILEQVVGTDNIQSWNDNPATSKQAIADALNETFRRMQEQEPGDG